MRITSRIWLATCAAICLTTPGITALAFAQQGSTAVSPKNMVTVTGCIERMPAAWAGATGTSGSTTASSSDFLLTHAQTSPAGAKSGSFRLDGTASVLSRHTGHKVEITGTVEERAGRSDSLPRDMLAMLRVDTVKMLSSACPG